MRGYTTVRYGMLKLALLLTSLTLLVASEFSISEDDLITFRTGLDSILKNIEPANDFKYSGQSHKVPVDPTEQDPGQKVKRDSGCPGGEGNYGFNSFNFMTFVLMIFNLVANVNNNLNNRDWDISQIL